MNNKQQKDTTLETLRGAVIILVVVGHVIGSGSDGGMKVKDDSFLRYLYSTVIELIQMPLFTVIAGWVYALRPVTKAKAADFIQKKIWRVLVPMFVVGLCYFLLQYFTPGTNRKGNLYELWKLLFFPYTLFWYLYSLFLVFLIITVADILNAMKSFNHWLILFVTSVFAVLIRDVVIPYGWPNYFSYKGALYLLPCFLLGVGLYRFKEVFQSPVIKYSIPVILMVSIVIQQLSWFKIIDYPVVKDNVAGLLIGLTGTMMLLRLRMKINWLIWFGGFAYSIYLFHAFGTAGGRILIQKFHIQSAPVIFTVSLAAGLLLPVAAEKILSRFKITSTLFLGKK